MNSVAIAITVQKEMEYWDQFNICSSYIKGKILCSNDRYDHCHSIKWHFSRKCRPIFYEPVDKAMKVWWVGWFCPESGFIAQGLCVDKNLYETLLSFLSNLSCMQ